MADILKQIVACKRIELKRFKERRPFYVLQRRVESMMDDNRVPSMCQALLNSPTGIIAEYKRRSPSKGWINEQAQPEVVPLAYQDNGAAAISILTDEYFFGGKDEFIDKARKAGVSAPILYKNFVIDEYQIYQARLCGASAVLLIAADLSLRQCARLIRVAHQLQLEVLLELHDEKELRYAELDADMLGINNRNLGSFVTDVENSFRMAQKLPKGKCWVSESGISNPEVVSQLREAGFRGFLIGENFMKTDNPGKALSQFIRQIAK